jgi:uncharacterized membrane protein YvlD (DUF360 family)
MGLLINWCILTFSFVVASKLIDGFKLKGGLFNQFLVAGLFAILNVILGRVLFVAIGIGTLGLGFLLAFLARLVATAIVLKITDALTSKLSVKSFGTAFVAALVISVIASVTEYVLGMLRIG